MEATMLKIGEDIYYYKDSIRAMKGPAYHIIRSLSEKEIKSLEINDELAKDLLCNLRDTFINMSCNLDEALKTLSDIT